MACAGSLERLREDWRFAMARARVVGCSWWLAVGLALGGCRVPDPAPRQLLLITVDTLRVDRLGAYGGRFELTPNLDALASESVLFERAYAPVPLTLPSIAALLTGRYPESIGVRSNSSLRDPAVATLASVLRAQGFRTGALVSNYVLRREAGLHRGFDHYDDAFSESEASRDAPERTAAHTTNAALRMFDALEGEGEQPIFLWVHYQDPHGPYTPPRGFRRAYLEAERAAPDGRRLLPRGRGEHGFGSIPRYQFLAGQREVAFYRAGYDGEVRYMDAEVGRLLAELRAQGALRDTVVVFTADHGEALGENDCWFAHGEYLSDALVRVPLLIRVPGRPPARRLDPASLLDLMPTLAALLGVEPPEAARGRDLLAPGAERGATSVYLANLDEAVVPRIGLVDGGYKYVVSGREGEQSAALVRLGRDRENLVASHPGVAASMERRLRELRDASGDLRERRQVLSAEDRRRLRALGYADGASQADR